MSDRSVHVVAFGRTAFGRFHGALAGVPARELGRLAIDAVRARIGNDSVPVDALYSGVGMIGGGALAYVRQMLLTTGLPQETPSLAIDRACCSGMTALGLAWKDIRLGEADLVIAGGIEGLSTTPYLLPRAHPPRPGDLMAEDPLTMRSPLLDRTISQYTSDEAVRFGVDRARQDAWAARSHACYFEEEDGGGFAEERLAVHEGETLLAIDEAPRRGSDIAALSRLKTVYGTPTITAGNAPGLSDGAAFLALASGDACARHGLAPLAELVDYVQIAGSPISGSYTPAIAVRRLLDRARLTLEQISAIEINEAFAATVPVSLLHLAGMDRAHAEELEGRTNVRGGAVAIGHPLGASGARIAMSLVQTLRRGGGGAGVAAICGGFGQGDAVLMRA